MTAYLVAATRLDQLLPDGSEKKHRRGDVVSDLSDDDVARHLASGGIVPASLLTSVEDDPEPPAPAGGGNDPSTGEPPQDPPDPAVVAKPDEDATNKVLGAWIVDNVAKEDGSDYTKTEVGRLNKEGLWDIINSVED